MGENNRHLVGRDQETGRVTFPGREKGAGSAVDADFGMGVLAAATLLVVAGFVLLVAWALKHATGGMGTLQWAGILTGGGAIVILALYLLGRVVRRLAVKKSSAE
ncbi:MAG: hypothetical protein JRI97_06530 [Deltaproteobacteria bacterium]|nr:hypothetical protein [Deltaproteobacteria bacterium]